MLPSRTRLPDIGGHRQSLRESASLPPQGSSNDPFFQGHSKIYNRRREIDAELRREFSLPEEQLNRDFRGDRSLLFGRLPPAPQPRRTETRLPEISRPQVQSEPPARRRWGNSDWHSEDRLPPAPPPPSGIPPQRVNNVDRDPSSERLGRDRPESWRKSLEEQAAAQLGPAAMRGPRVDLPPMNGGRRMEPPPPPPHIQSDDPTEAAKEKVQRKARDLEELSREFHEKRKARAARLRAEQAERNAKAASEKEYGEQPQHHQIHQAKKNHGDKNRKAEVRPPDDSSDKENVRKQQENDEDVQGRKEQDDWEREIRKRFREEQRQHKKRFQQEMDEATAMGEEHRAEKVQDSDRNERKRNSETQREQRRKAEADKWRRRMEGEENERLRGAADAHYGEEDVLPPAPPPPPPPPRQRGYPPPGASAGNGSSPLKRERKFPGAAAPDGANSTRPARDRFAGTGASPTNSNVRAQAGMPTDEAVRHAENAAMQQLKCLKMLPTKEEKQKAFKELLRSWHPDKNPQNVEVATAVFQRLNAERKKVLL